MFGLDDSLAGYSDGVTLWLVVVVAILLGLRHATDPDHVVAVTTLLADGRERAARSAARLGMAWGLGHALTLFVFGLPVLLFAQALPERVQRGAETAVAALIVYLAVRLPVAGGGASFASATIPMRMRGAALRSPPSASGSSTAWAGAPASASCSSQRSTRGQSPCWRWGSSRSSRQSR
jgi:hypothetical protein